MSTQSFLSSIAQGQNLAGNYLDNRRAAQRAADERKLTQAKTAKTFDDMEQAEQLRELQKMQRVNYALLQIRDPQQRQARFMQIAPQLGIDPQAAAQEDLSDQALEFDLRRTMDIAEQLKVRDTKAMQFGDSIQGVTTDGLTGQTVATTAAKRGPSYSEATARMNAETNRAKQQNPPQGGEIRLPDGTVVRTGGNVKEFQARPTVLAPGVAEAAKTLTTIFDGRSNPLNTGRNVAAAGAATIPGAGGALSGAIGGQDFQNVDQPRNLAKAAILPILSGAAITATEMPMFERAFLPQVGDTPMTAHLKALTVQEMASRVAMLQAQGAELSEEQAQAILFEGQTQLQRRLSRAQALEGQTTTQQGQSAYSPDNPFAQGLQ